MLKIGKVLLVALFVSFLSSSLHGMDRARRYMPSLSERTLLIGMVALPAAVIAGGIALIYHLITKEESHEEMYGRINRLYITLFDHYKDMVHGEFIHSSTEEDLSKYITKASLFEMKFHSISSDIRQLKEASNVLEARYLREVAANNTSPIIAEMHTLLLKITSFIPALEPLNMFWQNHKDFFRATKATAGEIAVRYKKILEHSHDQDFIKRTIMSFAVNALKKVDYPYIYFVTTLKNDIANLTTHKQKVERYPLIYGRIISLICDLQELLDTIVMMPEYTADDHRKKQHELEQERIAIERQKAEAERAKVAAMERQAAAERAKANAMYEQAAAERAKANAIKEQTMMQLMQQQTPQVLTINVQSPAQTSPAVEKQSVKPSKPSPSKPTDVGMPVKPTESVPFTPAIPSAPADDTDTAKLFETIENISASAIGRLDFHMPQLEQRYGSADKAIINGYSLISAAINAKNLDAFNKAELIAWLKNYGIYPTSADKQAARQTNEQMIINAVGA